jgi:flagellar hook-associated protein 3 FlgL
MQIDPYFTTQMVRSLDQSTASEQQLTQELSSGVRVTNLSVDPVAAATNARLNQQIGQDDTFVQTASSEQGRLQVTDGALGSVVTALTSALSVAVQGVNGTQDAADTQAVATQLSSLRDQVLSLANTSYLGGYIFSGSQTQTQPYTLDTSTSPATVTYNGDNQTQTVQTPSGQAIQTNVPGSSIFSSASGNVLGTLNQLIADFSSGTASASSISDTAALKTALDNVSQQRITIGNSLSQFNTASTYTQTQETQLESAQSTLMSADTAQVATSLSTLETQNTALLNVISTIEKGSLFDYTH